MRTPFLEFYIFSFKHTVYFLEVLFMPCVKWTDRYNNQFQTMLNIMVSAFVRQC